MAAPRPKRVWEVCEPHPDVFSRDPDPSLFAISLHHVMQADGEERGIGIPGEDVRVRLAHLPNPFRARRGHRSPPPYEPDESKI